MPFDLQDVVNDPDLAEPFNIIRSTGSFVAGGWQDTKTVIPSWGVVTVATDKQIQMLPEADRVTATRMFFTEDQIFTTELHRPDGTSGTSDILEYGGHQYRIWSLGLYDNRGGFYAALAQRMEGN
jgi:hypothetical protein